MTVRISPHKVSRIMRHYFGGQPQAEIAKKAGVDQSTVSLYATRFKERVKEIGLLPAGTEFYVFNEVDELRSLSVELSKANLTVEESKQGLQIMKSFMMLGVNPEQHRMLVKVCNEIRNPDFIHAAVKLSNIETESNMSYEKATSRFESAVSKLPSVEKQLEERRAELKSATEALSQKNKELLNLNTHIVQTLNEAKTKAAELDQELSNKMKQLEVRQGEVEEVAKLKMELAKLGLDIPTLARLAKEF